MARGLKQDQAGASSPLNRMLLYVAEGRIPRRVARENIAKGFKHKRSAPAYTGKEVTSINQMALVLGYRRNTSLYPANGRLPRIAEGPLCELYSISEDSNCWRHFCHGESEEFIKSYDKSHSTPTTTASDEVSLDK